MTQKFKIAIIRPGVHTLDEQFCYYLAKNGFDVTLIVPKNSVATPNKINNPNFQVKLLKAINFGRFVDFPITVGLYWYLKKEEFDIVQSNEDFQFITWISVLYSKLNNKPFFLIEEKYVYPRFKIQRFLFRIFQKLFCSFVWIVCKKIICHSKACLLFMRKSIKNKKLREKLLFLPVGINTDIFYPVKILKNAEYLRIITVGRLVDHKDYPTLLKAVNHLLKNQLKIKLTIIGKGLLKDYILRLIESLNLKKNVSMIKEIPFGKLREYYSRYDLFILSSIRECVGAVTLEAMACGLPVIVSDAGGTLDFVEVGKNGYLFKRADYLDLADKILKLTSRQKRQQFEQESLRLAKEKYNWDILVQKYITIFKDR